MKRMKNRTAVNSLTSATVIGTAISLGVTLAVAGICAVCINNEYIGIERKLIMSVIAQFFSSFAGSLFAAVLAKERKNIASVLTGAVYYFMLLIIAMLFFDGVGVGALVGIASNGIGVACAIFVNYQINKSAVATKKRGRYR